MNLSIARTKTAWKWQEKRRNRQAKICIPDLGVRYNNDNRTLPTTTCTYFVRDRWNNWRASHFIWTWSLPRGAQKSTFWNMVIVTLFIPCLGVQCYFFRDYNAHDKNLNKRKNEGCRRASWSTKREGRIKKRRQHCPSLPPFEESEIVFQIGSTP